MAGFRIRFPAIQFKYVSSSIFANLGAQHNLDAIRNDFGAHI